jgi:hypothetical protein
MSTLTLTDECKPQGLLRFLFMNVEDLARMAWGRVFGRDDRADEAFVPHQEQDLGPAPKIWLPRSCSSHLEKPTRSQGN